IRLATSACLIYVRCIIALERRFLYAASRIFFFSYFLFLFPPETNSSTLTCILFHLFKSIPPIDHDVITKLNNLLIPKPTLWIAPTITNIKYSKMYPIANLIHIDDSLQLASFKTSYPSKNFGKAIAKNQTTRNKANRSTSNGPPIPEINNIKAINGLANNTNNPTKKLLSQFLRITSILEKDITGNTFKTKS